MRRRPDRVRALPLVGDPGAVIFDDISEELLGRCRDVAGGDARCRFVEAPVTAPPLADESVDAVTVRSVLIYVPEKQQAIDELHRVLVTGGCLSLFEPLNGYGYPEPRGAFFGSRLPTELRPPAENARRTSGPRSTCPSTTPHDWSERDLLLWVQRAGFTRNEYEATFEVKQMEPIADFEIRLAAGGKPARAEPR